MKLIKKLRFSKSINDKMMHSHSEHQVSFLEKGTMQIFGETMAWPATSGHLVIIPSNVLHAATSSGKITGVSLYLSGLPILQPAHGISVLNPTNLTVELIQWLLRQKSLDSRQVKTALTLLGYEIKNCTQAELNLILPKSDSLLKVAKAIYQSGDRTTKVQQLARKVHMSERSFTRHFKNETGLTFERWRIEASHRKALELLTKGKSVSDVAFFLGYESVSAFVVSFKRSFGKTPGSILRNRLS